MRPTTNCNSHSFMLGSCACESNPTILSDIYITSGPAPLLANKWIVQRPFIVEFMGAHWVSWLPLKGTRHMAWVAWLWGIAKWEGCGVMWNKNKVVCSLCQEWHQIMVHGRLTQCARRSTPSRAYGCLAGAVGGCGHNVVGGHSSDTESSGNDAGRRLTHGSARRAMCHLSPRSPSLAWIHLRFSPHPGTPQAKPGGDAWQATMATLHLCVPQ